MLGILFLVGLGLVVYLAIRGSHKTPSVLPETLLANRNSEWVRFIAAYRKIAKSKEAKALVDRMLADIQAQGLAPVVKVYAFDETNELSIPQPQEAAAAVAAESYVSEVVTAIQEPKAELDNASLLLYFGAFLFVASVGLFIVFGGASGAVRTISVLLVMGVLYGGGIWLFRSKPKLIQAGIAFSGIGMTIAPLAGVAAYYYLFNQTRGPVIWFITSLMCLGMYVHGLVTFRKPLISYILIFTFLSLFESGVSIISAPIYYFGWAMALVGIILVVVSRLKGFWPEMQESSRASSRLILPLSILASIALLPTHGAGQLGVSLLLGAAFYGLEALNTQETLQEYNAAATHILAIGGLTSLAYAAGNSWKMVAISLLLINTVQMLAILLLPQRGRQWQNFGSIAVCASLLGIAVAVGNPVIVLAAVAATAVSSIIVWLRQARTEAYMLSIIAWMALPLVFGQYFLTVRLNATSQGLLLLSALWIQLGTYLWHKSTASAVEWQSSAQQIYVVSAVAVLVASLFATPWICLLLTLGTVATMIMLSEYEHDADWAVVGGILLAVPIFRAVETQGPLLAATLTALMLNILLAFKYRKELNRWFSSITWLLLPLALGTGLLGHWTASSYGWAYVGVMMVLILSRAIARGNLLVSSKVPLASYVRTASYSYVFGYVVAAIAAVSVSLMSINAQLHATIILGILAAVVYGLGRYIEKRDDIMALLPLLFQAILWSAVRPQAVASSMVVYLLASTGLAVASYFIIGDTLRLRRLDKQAGASQFSQSALLTVFLAPASIFIASTLVWPMPFGLLAAGSLLYFHLQNTSQQNREFAGGIIVASVLWFMWYFGIRELQAYTHVTVLALGFYALWRASRNETTQCDQYLMAMLLVATVPLGLQALAGQSGGLYGWWLLLEQIGFMLLGMVIKKRLVTMWGLYVAVGAVLYQLRHLGWAALTVLAVFLIGIAIYKLQKHDVKV